MIVSHRYRFIFVKTARVAGTSLEMALSRLLGPEDIITPVSGNYVPNNEVVRFQRGFRTAQNFEKRIHELRPRDLERFLKAAILSRVRRTAEGRLLARTRFPHRYWGHMSSEEIRARVGPDAWDSYYKFTVERNPWDKLVAAYHRKKDPPPFREFVLANAPVSSQFERYTVGGRLAMDRIIRYDRLYEELAEVSARIGLPEDVGETMRSFSANASRRPGRDFRPFYDDETRELVALYCAREIRLMGFSFDDGAAP
jgi:hypothetical protein